jgi:large subunit ribosomal protein L22
MDQIRGLDCEKARNVLKFSDKRAAVMIAKVLKSAMANAEENGKCDRRKLVVSSCWVDEGPTRRSWLPRARGSATPLLHRSSHLSVCVAEKEEGIK